MNISESLTPAVLRRVNLSRVSSAFGDLLRHLEPALLLSYSGREPGSALTYPEPAGVPEPTPVSWRLSPTHEATPRLTSAAARLGGLNFFLYLFARVSWTVVQTG